MRNAIIQKWAPQPANKPHDADGRGSETQPPSTQLIISLNADGSIFELRVDKGSGDAHLDEEAMRATRAAAPFVNPPPALLDPTSGLIEFRFVFSIGGRIRHFRK